MEMLDKTQLQWLLAGVGVIVVVLIYLWGMRAHIREGIRKRQRRPSLQNEPVFSALDGSAASDEINNGHDFGGVRITPEHPLAKKALIDVEIRPIHREEEPLPPGEEAPVIEAAPVPETMEAAPVLEASASLKTEQPVIVAEPTHDSRKEPAMPEPPKMTVALTVVAVPVGQSSFKGPDIQAMAADLGFQIKANGLLERCTDNGNGEPILSMAHLRKPGVFDRQTMDDLITPGLLLFMSLPGPLEEMKALDLLVLTADQLAQKLGGMICDERRNRLTNQGLMHLRNEVVEFRRKQRAWAQAT
ncbi:MAG: hypothetical protein H6974_07210 [Gammaproteobacteria bacterium]|nr:hypothetical protein [Gammaproteobacteria bacterium]MCP5196559.1 hypothetical protein [Gammaproteobacteria bacterium]